MELQTQKQQTTLLPTFEQVKILQEQLEDKTRHVVTLTKALAEKQQGEVSFDNLIQREQLLRDKEDKFKKTEEGVRRKIQQHSMNENVGSRKEKTNAHYGRSDAHYGRNDGTNQNKEDKQWKRST